MKFEYLIALVLTVLLLQSCEIYFIPCTTEKHPDEIITKLMPVKTGNKWNYTVSLYEKNEVVSRLEQSLEIANLDTVFYKDRDLNKHNLLIYRVLKWQEEQNLRLFEMR